MDREYKSLDLLVSFRLCCSSRSHNFHHVSERINAVDEGENFEACCRYSFSSVSLKIPASEPAPLAPMSQ